MVGIKSSVKKVPECFYKEAFCKAVTGHTDRELREIVSQKFVNPIDEKVNLSVGRDMPRDIVEEAVDKYSVFMNTEFGFSMKKDIEELFSYFGKFRDWERHVHPRNTGNLYEAYFEPTYISIEHAKSRGDEVGVREGISSLINKILHD